MCTCASCEYTDELSGWKFENGQRVADDKGGFANWPRGNPAGKRSSDASYAAHVAHLWKGVARGWEFKPGQPERFPMLPGLVHPVQPNATAIRWNAQFGKPYVPAPAPAAPVEKASVSLIGLARELRRQERERRQSDRKAA